MLKKVYLNKANENWILDRLRAEWYTYNSKISSKTINSAETIWICSPWTWKKLNQNKLRKKKVICSIYHIDEEKFDNTDLIEFNERDQFVDFYHVISNHTKDQLCKTPKGKKSKYHRHRIRFPHQQHKVRNIKVTRLFEKHVDQ